MKNSFLQIKVYLYCQQHKTRFWAVSLLYIYFSYTLIENKEKKWSFGQTCHK